MLKKSFNVEASNLEEAGAKAKAALNNPNLIGNVFLSSVELSKDKVNTINNKPPYIQGR